MSMVGNPILKEGFIEFSKIKTEDYTDAFERGLKEQDKNIADIVGQKEPPTFENTIVALEYSAETLDKVCNILFNLTEANTNDALDALAQKYSPILTKKNSEIMQNEALFKRVKSVYDSRESLNLDAEERKLLEETYISFVRSGANLNADDKARFAELSTELSTLTLQFSQNVLKETNSFSMQFKNASELAGLPDYELDAAAHRAKEIGEDGYVVNLTMPSYFAFMKFADNRELRKKLYIKYSGKGNRGGENDNTHIVEQIVCKRLEKARIMGNECFADQKLERTMAENKESVYNLLDNLYDNYMPKAREEMDELTQYARRISGDSTFVIEPWDWAYYSEKLKEEKYDLNEGMVKPYFELGRVKKGVFSLAGKLYGLHFTLNNNIDRYHPDVEVYDVTDNDGNYIATFYADFFPRASKQGGAWMTEFRGERTVNGVSERPYISIVTNFSIPTDTTPSLLTFGEVTTLLHEFGHALHGMLANTKYRSLSGTNVYRDFVELPSQIMENFAYEQCFLDEVAIHYQTGEKIPAELIQKLRDTENYHIAYACIRQLNFGYLDMAWHTITEPWHISGNATVESFERKACEKTSLMEPLEGTCVSTAFGHIFSGGYAAGYYSYKWAEVLDADAFALFKENGVLNPETALKFKRLLQAGGTVHPMTLYLQFRGQKPTVEALLKRNGIRY